MSGRRRPPAPRFALAAAATFISLAASADAELPDAEFLEYLGSWDSSDEDWVILLDKDMADGAKGETRSETAGEDAESREQQDDS